jgi:hypothetical protein
VKAVAFVLAALALAGCESNQERSAKLERASQRLQRETRRRATLALHGLSITHQSTKVKAIATAVVKGAEGAAAVVTVRNVSSTSLRDVPIQIDVRNADGASIYTNEVPGLSATLASVALIPAHTALTWIDDQVQTTATPASVTARIGEGAPVAGAAPSLNVEGVHLSEGQAEGNLANHSAVGQQELVVNAVSRRAGRVIAAGRAVLPTAPAGSSTPFQIFFVGDPSGGRLEVSAPATTSG